MQSEIYNTGKPCAAYWTRRRAFSISGNLSAAFDALYARHTFALHGIGRYVAKPQKVTRSRAPAARYCKSRNGAIHTRRRQILHESNKHEFWFLISSLFCCQSVHLDGSWCLVYHWRKIQHWQNCQWNYRRRKANANKYHPDKVSIYQPWWPEVENVYSRSWLIG